MEFSSARAIARTAYIFTFPLVMSYGDLYAQVVDSGAPSHRGSSEEWNHWRAIPSDRLDRSGGVLQASAWVDVGTEPCVVAFDKDQLSLRVSDLWSFDAPSRAPETIRSMQTMMLVAPAWIGDIAPDVDRVVRGESAFLRLLVSAKQDRPGEGLADTTLPRTAAHASNGGEGDGSSLNPAPNADWVPWSAGDAVTNHYWSCANFALSLVEPHVDDRQVLDRIGEIGVVPGESWDAGWFSFEVLDGISDGVDQALSDLLAATAGPVDRERLHCSRAGFDRDYFGRALSAIADRSLTSVGAVGRLLVT